MAAAGVKVTGLKELALLMQQLPEKIERNVMRGALRAGAKVLEEEALRHVPVDSGDLRKSLKVSTRNKQGTVTARLSTNVFYARWVEYGTGAHWISVNPEDAPKRLTRGGVKAVSVATLNDKAKSGSLKIGENFVGASVAHPGAKPQPFMRPALDAKSGEAIVAAAEYMKKRLATKHGLDTSDVSIREEAEDE